MPEQLRSIDLFAGVGGIRLGFERAFKDKLDTVFVSEFDPYPVKTYAANFNTPDIPLKSLESMTNGVPYIYGDITAIKEEDIPEFDICLAGFPCQAFSKAGKQQGFNDNYKGRTRGTLFRDIVRICEYHKPKVIFCENVKNLTKHDKGNTFKTICGAFEEIGYKVFYKVLNSYDFGVPQKRERIYIVCFRHDIAPDNFVFPAGKHYEDSNDSPNKRPTIKDILDAAPIPSKYYLSEQYLNGLKKHKAKHQAKGHGFGYNIRELDGPTGTITCSASGREGNMIIDHRKHSMTPTTNISSPINTEDVRMLTPREFARLQGFPDDFQLVGSDTRLYKQMGNSITVPVIEAIALEIKRALSE